MTTLAVPASEPVLRHALTLPLDNIEWRDSGNGEDFTLRGHAAVFNKLSEDLGGFKELVEPGAFRAVLRTSPDVRLLFNHDPNFVMARTASATLELREDSVGLHVWARVAPLTWVKDLRASMQRGDVDQMSFAFTVDPDLYDWTVGSDGTIVATVRADGVTGLYDASVVTYPAYSQTDAAMRSALDDAVKRGRLVLPGTPKETIAPHAGGRLAASRAAFEVERELAAQAHPKRGDTSDGST